MRIGHMLLILLGLAATCGAAAQESPTLRKVKESGVITIGYRDKSIPFSYLDKQQRPIGYAMDMCQRVVDAIKLKLDLPGLEVMYRPVTAANRVAFVVNDIIDLECGSTSNTIERQRDVAFSVTTFVTTSSMAYKQSQEISGLADLRGRTIVSTAGTTTIKALTEWNRLQGKDTRILAGRDHAEAFLLMETDRAAAFVMDDALLYGLVASSPNPRDFVIRSADLSLEPYGMMMRKNDPEFKQVVDDAIVALYQSGEIQPIYRKWFLTPIVPNNIVLQLPMSAALKKTIAKPTDSGDPAAYR